jgi:ribosomal protein S18 acetylase RimI-like enzyme
VLLAECDGQLVANCHIERQGESGYVGMFAVNPNRQDGGFGKAVLVEAVRMARERWHCRAMRMTVMKNAAN